MAINKLGSGGFNHLGTPLGTASIPSFVPSGMRANPPDVYLNFQTNQAWIKSTNTTTTASSLTSISRASIATQVDSLGAWSQVSSNALARSDQGVAVWEARTNGIRNNTMQGASAGTPGTVPTNWFIGSLPTGISSQIVGTGTTSGITYIDIRLFGTASSSNFPAIFFETGTGIAGLYGQTWSSSAFFAEAPSSTRTNTPQWSLQVQENNSGGSFLAGHAGSSFTLPSSLTSQTYAVTPTNSATAFLLPYVACTLNSGTAYDFTIRIGWPQLENNALINSTVASAVKTANGTGGVNSTGVYSVGGGTGTATTLNCTWAAGVLTVNSVASAGSYTVLPPSPATLTYVSGTATGWTGATVTLTPADNSTQAAPSNPIPTTGSAVARAADVVTLTTPSAFGTAYSLYASGSPGVSINYASQCLFDADNGGGNQVGLYRLLTGLTNGYANPPNASASGSVWAQANPGKLAASIIAGNQQFSGIGLASASIGTGGTIPAGMTTVRIGASVSGASPFNGNVTEIAIWYNQALSAAALQTATTTVPAPAQLWSFANRTFFDDFASISTIDTANTKAAGFNWYVNNAWPNAGSPWTTATATQAGDISVSNSVLTLATDRSTFGETLNTAVSAVNANSYLGTVFTGGAYFETRFKFNPATALLADASWPAFWSTAVEYMAQNAAHFGEMDFIEAVPTGTGTVSMNSATLDWTSGSNNHSSNTTGLVAADANWHTYGRLWVPASLNSGTGLLKTYIDGVLVATVQYSATGGASPAFSPSNPNGVASIIDSQHFPIILGAGPSWSVQIDYVAVWQR